MNNHAAIRIRYRSADDELTERVISNVVVQSIDEVIAFCHLRGQERTFVLNRIEAAWDDETGEIIEDIWLRFGLPSGKPPPLSLPQFCEQRTTLTEAQAQRQRNEDKYQLFSRFKLDVLIDHKREEFRRLFSHQCFRCGGSRELQLDHHVPQILGGRLVPGNIVLLCSRCNGQKLEQHPNDFYSDDERARLMPLLEAQLKMFDFTFDWRRWTHQPVEYLLSLGIPLDAARLAVKRSDERIGVNIRVTAPGLAGWRGDANDC